MKLQRLTICLFCKLLLLASPLVAGEVATPLADAAEKDNEAAVATLLTDGCEVNQPQVDGMTALHWSAFHDREALVERLLAAGADVTVTNRYGLSPLSIACTNGNGKIVKMLLQAGADAQTTLPGGETALMTASRTGRLDAVEALLSAGASVNSKELNGPTALMWAAAEGNVQVLDALLKAGADFNTPLPSGFTPLFFAVREGRTAVALRLIEVGKLDIDAPMQGKGRKLANPLILAVENAHYETALALLEAGADANAQPKGYGALHAISWVRKPIRGDGNPPPVGSGKVSDLAFVREMVAHGADVNLRLSKGHSGFADFTTTGSSPFVLAARTGDLPLLRTLLELKADPTISNADKSTALLAATGVGDLGSGQQPAGTEQEAIETVKLLLQLGADINAVDENGETAMHGAAYQNWPELIVFLGEHGADVEVWNRKNKWGWTPLRIAQGHRKGNFRPDPATITAIELVMSTGSKNPPNAEPDAVADQPDQPD